jgi:hypothetical protein
MKKNFFFLFLFFGNSAIAQNEIKVYPESWWQGMKHNKIQLMVRKKISVIYTGIQIIQE